MKIITFLFGSALLFSPPAFSSPESRHIVCRGQTKIFPGGHESIVTLGLPDIQANGRMGLYHPVAFDFEAGVSLAIISIQKLRSGTKVIARYEDELDGILSFEYRDNEDGSYTLANFKGFEMEFSFGPTDVLCKEE